MSKKFINEWPDLILDQEKFSEKINSLYKKFNKQPCFRCFADESRCCPLTLIVADFTNSDPNKLAFLDIAHMCAKILQVEGSWVQSFCDEWDEFSQKEPDKSAISIAKHLKEIFHGAKRD